MQCYKELTAPTAVTHSIALNFTSPDVENLIVAKGSLLQIFYTTTIPAEVDAAHAAAANSGPLGAELSKNDTTVNNDMETSFLGGEGPLQRTDRGNNTKLVLVAEFPIAASICGLAKVKLPESKFAGDALLVAMRDAKMTLLGWQVESNSIESLSIHYYEQEELDGAPWEMAAGDYDTYLEADPSGRCVTLKFGPKSLAILPFKQADGDIAMDDWDNDLDGSRPKKEEDTPLASTEAPAKKEVPYSSSFVLKLPQLDPALLHPVHIAFLHGYQEPTFSIISSTQSRSYALGRKDSMSYRVFTLDLQKQQHTLILSVENLPSDLFRILPLPAPMGGALLIGDNELIHIDQSGKPNGVAVNSYTKETTSYTLADQSDLGLKLEYCMVEQLALGSNELVLILNDGRLAVVVFKVDGRTVSGLTIKLVAPEQGGDLIPSMVTCITRLGKNALFIGSEDTNSYVLGWTRKQNNTLRRKTRLLEDTLDYDMDDLDLDDEDEDDDLYGENAVVAETVQETASSEGGDIIFKIHDTLLSIAPIRGLVSASTVPATPESKDAIAPLQLALSVGRGRGGAVVLVNKAAQPAVIGRFAFPEAQGVWTIAVRKPVPKALQGDRGKATTIGVEFDPLAQYHKFMIVAKKSGEGSEVDETSDVYSVTGADFSLLKDTEFEPDVGITIEAGVMGSHTRVIQVLKSEVRSYDGDFGLSQIVPMLDDETDAEPQIISASIADPFLLLLRDDSSIFIAQMDNNCELEEVEKGEVVAAEKYIAGCLYADVNGTFVKKEADQAASVLAFLVTESGKLNVYNLPNLEEPIFTAEGLAHVPYLLQHDVGNVRRGFVQEIIDEIVVVDLGDRINKSTYLVLRNSNNDLIIYSPISLNTSDDLNSTLRFAKVINQTLAQAAPGSADVSGYFPLRVCPNIGGYNTLFLPGPSPSFLIKDSKSLPRVIGLQSDGVRAFASFHTEGCERGFIYSDFSGVTRVAQLPARAYFGLGVSVTKIPLGMNAKHIAFHPSSGTIAVACTTTEEFELPKDDDYHKEWQKETAAQLTLKPLVEKSVVRLFDPTSWIEIETMPLDQFEVVHAMKTLSLEVSEVTKERRQMITLGTSISRGEDLPVRGRIYVFDVVHVIPEPGKPHTARKLKLIAKEEIPRGAVTALSEIGTQGLMLLSQGQKCMVRGLKEDGSLLPVAFLDMNCYVTTAKELKGSGLCVLTDAFKGLWFVGSTEEPYRMQLFGKSSSTLDIVTADFLPDGDQLFIIASGFDGDVHVLQYDPDDPKSLQGHMLLHRTTFATACNAPTISLLLPRAQPTSPEILHMQPHTLLLASPSGMLAAVDSLSESAYRRLLSLSVQLINNLPQYAAVNPRAWRVVRGEKTVGIESASGRAIVDGGVLARWGELSSGKRAELAGKIGMGVGEVRDELGELLGWSGLNYY